MDIILDIETDGLDYTKIHCMVAYSLDNKEYTLFIPKHFKDKRVPKNLEGYKILLVSEFEEWTKENEVGKFIMHNGIAFDRKVLRKCLDMDVPLSNVIDTLIMSRLLSVEKPKHSVEFYGTMLGKEKPKHESWDFFSWPMMRRCLADVQIQKKIYELLLAKMEKNKQPWETLWLEQDTQEIMLQQTDNGFYLDPKKSQALYDKLETRHKELTKAIREAFPIQPKRVDDFDPKVKKDGEFSSIGLKFLGPFCDALMPEGLYPVPQEIIGGPCSKITWQEFNLNSPKQRVERLLALGWEPVSYTKGGAPQLTEESLEQQKDRLPPPALLLSEYMMVQSRLTTVKQWLDLRDSKGYVHGQVLTIGARTHRMAHRNPNMGNVPRVGSPYGAECRDCWSVEDKQNHVLVGCDASGIQLRALAHYAGDKGYIDLVSNPEVDIHSVHSEALGCDRNTAKTFIYAWLLNAGKPKLGAILGGSTALGARTNKRFLERMPFLGKVKEKFERYGETSNFVALDGRRIYIPSAHLALSTGLQSFEAIVMKWVLREIKRRIDFPVWQRNLVHDEFQIETHKDNADHLGQEIVQLFSEAGQALGSLCPLTGEYVIGQSWKETH